MDFAGLIGKFSANRPLTEQEKKSQLHQNQRLPVQPDDQLSIIEMNSAYLESVDKWYGSKGTITAVTLTIIIMFSLAYVGLLYTAMTRVPIPGRDNDDVGILIFAAVIFSPLLVAAGWTLLKESFSFTHYPMRFDRKNRTLHVFRKNGTILSTPWNTVFFTLGQVDQVYKFWNILGHVMADDKKTVIETFALSATSTGSPEEMKILHAHWEFIRRYMEEGPESVMDQVTNCLPIKHRYETVGFGMRRLLANGTGLKTLSPTMGLNMLIAALTLPFRVFAMRTSKIPRWPAEIDASTPIPHDDPYAIAGSPTGGRISLFPAAATTADRRFS